MLFHHRTPRPPLDGFVDFIWLFRSEPRPLALDCGYFDQAHFIHDFRAFAGLTPTAYQEARTEFRNHVKFLQSGAAVF